MASHGNGAHAPPVGHENINTDIVTLNRFLTEEQNKHPEATGDFTLVPLVCPSCARRVPVVCGEQDHRVLTFID